MSSILNSSMYIILFRTKYDKNHLFKKFHQKVLILFLKKIVSNTSDYLRNFTIKKIIFEQTYFYMEYNRVGVSMSIESPCMVIM